MRVFNITDHDTHALRAQGRFRVPVQVGDKTIQPGANAVVEQTSDNVRDARVLQASGLVAIDDLPPWYVRAHGLPEGLSKDALEAATMPPSGRIEAEASEPVEEWPAEEQPAEEPSYQSWAEEPTDYEQGDDQQEVSPETMPEPSSSQGKRRKKK